MDVINFSFFKRCQGRREAVDVFTPELCLSGAKSINTGISRWHENSPALQHTHAQRRD